MSEKERMQRDSKGWRLSQKRGGSIFQCVDWGRKEERQAGGKHPNLDFGYAKSEFLSDIHVGMVSRRRSPALRERSGRELRRREPDAHKAPSLREITRGG